MSAGCADCGRPYGDDGFHDLVIPNWVWRRISPSKNDGGLLCACCISARLTKAGIRCEGAFMSGPIETVSPRLMEALRRAENIEERLCDFDMRSPASCGTHPKDGDVQQAPLVSGAVPLAGDAQSLAKDTTNDHR
jgi:hypothetical protein